MAAARHARFAAVCALALLLGACVGHAPQVTAPAPPAAVPEPAVVPVPSVPVPAPGAAPSSTPVPQAPTPAEPDPDSAKYQLLDQGLASWYGPGLHGRRTASGERFDRFGFTAAHRTLPFGTRVCVRSLVTGKTVIVRINDRGPFGSGDRVIDLSQAAARELGMIGLGIKPVELRQADADGGGCASTWDDEAQGELPEAETGTARAGHE